MKLLRKNIKYISVFLGVNLLSNMFAPNIAYALTSGPTAPEYTSFEPVDTTDMVNMATGDLAYNLPLLEVPGPAGGYPISLSYHAGIMPNEEASWVGLGWTINQGAITRTVNGYPDDHNGALRTRKDFAEGGSRNTFSLGVGFAGISYGISISNDSNLGFGIGNSASVGLSKNFGNSGIGIGLNYSVGNDGYRNTYSGLKTGLTVERGIQGTTDLSYSVGVSSNFNSLSFHGGIVSNSGNIQGSYGLNSGLSIGASIGSNGSKSSLQRAGISANQHNYKASHVTIDSHGFSIPIPLKGPFSVTLGYKYIRYYINETSNVNVIGSLYGDKTFGNNYDSYAYDSYALAEIEKDITEQDPEKDRGGSFPAYDQYQVTAQGLSGTIRPFHNNIGHLMRQNLKKKRRWLRNRVCSVRSGITKTVFPVCQ